MFAWSSKAQLILFYTCLFQPSRFMQSNFGFSKVFYVSYSILPILGKNHTVFKDLLGHFIQQVKKQREEAELWATLGGP